MWLVVSVLISGLLVLIFFLCGQNRNALWRISDMDEPSDSEREYLEGFVCILFANGRGGASTVLGAEAMSSAKNDGQGELPTKDSGRQGTIVVMHHSRLSQAISGGRRVVQ